MEIRRISSLVGRILFRILATGLHTPEAEIDIKGIKSMRAVNVSDEGLKLGALVPIHTLATHSDIRGILPALAEAASAIAGPQLRRMGTLGGNLCLTPGACILIRLIFGVNRLAIA